MTDTQQPDIEQRLQELSLQEPSAKLDARVIQLLTPSDREPAIHAQRFSRNRFAMTAATFALIGFGLGWWTSPDTGSSTILSETKQRDPQRNSVAKTESPLTSNPPTVLKKQEPPRIVDQGFVLHNGEEPVRKYRIEGVEQNNQRTSLNLREEILLPSEEI